MDEFTGPGDVFLADWSARPAVEIIGDKWAIVVLYGTRRHGELLELVGGISKKVLTQTLRRLERHGLVRRDAERVAEALLGQAEIPRREDPRTPSVPSLRSLLRHVGSTHQESYDALPRDQERQPVRPVRG
jgi:DNA-binding HxlR family transcriptional regulator